MVKIRGHQPVFPFEKIWVGVECLLIICVEVWRLHSCFLSILRNTIGLSAFSIQNLVYRSTLLIFKSLISKTNYIETDRCSKIHKRFLCALLLNKELCWLSIAFVSFLCNLARFKVRASNTWSFNQNISGGHSFFHSLMILDFAI